MDAETRKLMAKEAVQEQVLELITSSQYYHDMVEEEVNGRFPSGISNMTQEQQDEVRCMCCNSVIEDILKGVG